MDLLGTLDARLADLDASHLRRRRRTAASRCAPTMRVADDGAEREMLTFCSNDYLGLASHPQVIAAIKEGVDRYGAGSGASHLISGHSIAHAQLEQRLAAFIAPHLDAARALYFCTGYMANLAVVTALADADTEIFSEALNHASLIDAVRLARVPTRIYPHGGVDALAGMLSASTARTKIIVTDAVFSMDGDFAPLPRLVELAERYDAWLVADDAHGIGVLGTHGRGCLEHFSLRSRNIVYVGTLGKAAGVSGAFVAAHGTVIEWLVNRARTYIFTTAAPPALAHALLTSIDLIEGEEGMALRIHLQKLIGELRAGLALTSWRLLPSLTAVQPVVLGENDRALTASAALYDEGLWVPAIRPPTVPPHTARLRVALSAAHTLADVARLARSLNRIEQEQRAEEPV
jgi:8-amino-7-oxononanoate synthase